MNAPENYIIFELGSAAYGLGSAEVLHVEMLEHLTPVPNTAAAVDGIVFSRGQVVPALNLRVRFGMPRAEPTPRTRLIFLKLPQRVVALIVDSAREFRSIPADAIKPIEQTLEGIEGNYVRGTAQVGGRLVLLLDAAAILRLDEFPGAAPVPAAAAS